MKHIFLLLSAFIMSSCSSIPDAGKPYFNFTSNEGVVYKYKSSREKIIFTSKKILHDKFEIKIISKYKNDYIYTPYISYIENEDEYKQACRIDLSGVTTKKDELRINCTRVKYEYGYQAGSIHNLFTKAWWGKGVSDLEATLLVLLKNEDK